MIFSRAALARKAERLRPRCFAAASMASKRAASRLMLARTVRPKFEKQRDHDRAFAFADLAGRQNSRQS